MIIFSTRYGFATNSSSSHSLVFSNGRPVSDDLDLMDGDSQYGWGNFTIASSEQKLRYLAAQMCSNEIDDQTISEITGLPIPPSSPDDKEWNRSFGYVDHQSVWSLPYEWSGTQRCTHWLETLKAFLLRTDVIVLGGNDNDADHPLAAELPEFHSRNARFNWDRATNNIPVETRGPIIARYDDIANYWTLFNRQNGTRHRVMFAESPDILPPRFASIPELVDLKITDKCPYKCSFCYQSSLPRGLHGNTGAIESILDALATLRVFEIALGGGEPTLHPDFDHIVEYARSNHITVNVTTRNLNWIESQTKETIARFGGIAYSVHNPQDVEDLQKIRAQLSSSLYYGPNISAQIVLGTITRAQFSEMLDNATGSSTRPSLAVTLLAYKSVGFGAHQPPINYDWWMDEITREGRYIRCNIDTPLARQYQRQLTAAGVDHRFYDTRDGAFSYYIDAVQMTSAPSSYEADLTKSRPLQLSGYPLSDSIRTGFNIRDFLNY